MQDDDHAAWRLKEGCTAACPCHLKTCAQKVPGTDAGGPSSAHPQVQKVLYTGRKENELRMPVTDGRSDLVHAKRQAWERESAANQWSISAREAANVAAVGGHGASCKRQGFRWASFASAE